MLKKKSVTSSDIITLFMDYVVENNSKPTSVDSFIKYCDIDEKSFYQYFNSFEKIEKKIFKKIFKSSLGILNENSDFLLFDNRNKILSLYFTLFESLSLNREYVAIVLSGYENKLKALSKLSGMKKSYFSFLDLLELDSILLKFEGIESFQKNTVKKTAWIQLLLILEFWLEDTSDSFEKTDIFIEKSINTSFDLLEHSFLNSFIDLSKFLYKEKFQST
jgi:hypothetical protein